MKRALDQPGLLEGDKCAALFDGFERLGGDIECDLFAQFRHEKCLFLEINLTSALACGVELGGADTVRIPASDARCFARDCACFCHIAPHATIHSPDMQTFDTIFVIAIIMFSAIVHEVMHGVAADWLGDRTARYAGRLTLNPFKHIDLFGSILLPLALALGGSPIFFGYAKPVPYNPYNLRADGLFARFSEAIVAIAGPFSNLAIAILFGVLIRLNIFGDALNQAFVLVVIINVALLCFNMIPVPPLDGSKVLASILPRSLAHLYARVRTALEMNPLAGMLIVVFIVYFLGSAYSTVIYSIAGVIGGFQ